MYCIFGPVLLPNSASADPFTNSDLLSHQLGSHARLSVTSQYAIEEQRSFTMMFAGYVQRRGVSRLVARTGCLKPTLRSRFLLLGSGPDAMAAIIRFVSGPEPLWRRCLERCWVLECDIDPLILQARWLHHQGQHHDATAVEEELHPVF